MSAPLIFVRDGRTLPFVPVTTAALAAITRACEGTRRLAYARSLYMALLELANEDRSGRVAVSRKTLSERSGCSRELISDLRPVLEQAGVAVVHERQFDGQRLENEWVVVEPTEDGPEERTPVPVRHDPLPARPDPPASEAQLPVDHGEGQRERKEEPAREDPRNQLPDGFPEDLRPHAREVFRILRGVAADHPKCKRVWPKEVGNAIMKYPRHPLVATAHSLAIWAVDPGRPIKNVVQTYSTFLSKERELAATERLASDGTATTAVEHPPGVTPIRRGRPMSNAETVEAQIRMLRGQA